MRSFKVLRRAFSADAIHSMPSGNGINRPSRFLFGLQVFGLFCGTALLIDASRMIRLGNSFDKIMQERAKRAVDNEQVTREMEVFFVQKSQEKQENDLDKGKGENRPL
jgi:hypothetical protein